MAFPVAVGDLWKVFELATRKKDRSRQALCEWLDQVYSDLDELQKIWIDIALSLEAGKPDAEDQKTREILDSAMPYTSAYQSSACSRSMQRVIAGRLGMFYKYASLVFTREGDQPFHKHSCCESSIFCFGQRKK